MRYPILSLVFAALVLCGCSKTASNSAPGTTAAVGPSGQPASSKPASSTSVCDQKIITAQDVASLFSDPVVEIHNISGDAQSCEFRTAQFSGVTISVRPGIGKSVIGGYTSGQMREFDKSENLPGVGDEAIRSLSLNRIDARKGDLLCEVSGPGMARDTGDPMIGKLAALCTKIFAAQAP